MKTSWINQTAFALIRFMFFGVRTRCRLLSLGLCVFPVCGISISRYDLAIRGHMIFCWKWEIMCRRCSCKSAFLINYVTFDIAILHRSKLRCGWQCLLSLDCVHASSLSRSIVWPAPWTMHKLTPEFLPRDATQIERMSSVPRSVTFRYRDHIGWNASKLIPLLNSLRYLLGLTPTSAIWSND